MHSNTSPLPSMKIPPKKYLVSIGLAGIILLLAGVILLTGSLFLLEKNKRFWAGIKTTARVISTFEHTCARGKWSSRCYDLSVLYTDQSGVIVTAVIQDQFDRPQNDQIPIMYAKDTPESVQWDNNIRRPWFERGRTTATIFIIIGLLLYCGSLLMTHRLSRMDSHKHL